jgi:hypothetical protein
MVRPLLALALVCPAVAHAQAEAPGSAPPPPASAASPVSAPPLLSGLVMNDQGQPVAGARLFTDDARFEAYSLADGTFSFEQILPGELVLLVEDADHALVTQRVTLLPDTPLFLRFELRALKKAEKQAAKKAKASVVVTGRRERSLTRYVLEKEALRTVPGSFGDPLRAIQNLPGINRPPYVLGVLLVRGTGPGDSAVFVDGHEVPLLYHFLGGPSVLPPDIIDRIDYLPGNFSARYGRAIGGIVDVATKPGAADHWQGTGDIDLFDAGVYVTGPIAERTTLAVAARRSYIDGVLRGAAALTTDEAATVLPVYYDYQLRLDHKVSKDHRVSLVVFGSQDDLTVVGEPGGTGPDAGLGASIGFHRIKGEWDARLTPDAKLTVSPVVGVDRTTFTLDELNIDGTVLEYALRADLRLRLSDDYVLNTGADVLGRVATLSADLPVRTPAYRTYPGSGFGDREAESLSRDVALTAYATYVEGELNPFDGPFTLVPGLRFDGYRFFGEDRFSIDPRLNVRVAVHDQVTLKAGAGLFSQAPTEFRLDPEFGNPKLDLEWAEHYAVGFESRPEEALTFETTLFLARRHDLSVRADDEAESTNGGLTPARFLSKGRGRSYGLEMLLRHDLTASVYGWISYTLMRSEESSGPGSPYVAFPLDQTHNVNAVMSWKLPNRWEVGARLRFVSGNPDTPITGGVKSADSGGYAPVSGAENSQRQSLFHQFDVRAEKTWVFDAWDLSFYLDVQNIENAMNAEFTTWDYRFRESAPVPGLPILPTFGLRGVVR